MASGQLTLLALTKTTFIMENKVECSCGYYQQDFLCKAHGDDDGDNLNTIHDEEQKQEEGCICSYDHQDILCRAHEDNDEAVEEKSSQSQSPAWQWLNLLIFTHNAYIVTLVDLKTRNILDNPELA